MPIDRPGVPPAHLGPERLTILHVVFSSRVAGAERYALDLAQAQLECGHRVLFATPFRTAIVAELPSGAESVRWGLPIGRGAFVRSVVRRERVDVGHAHLGPACRALAAAHGIARIATLHVGYKRHQHQHLDGLVAINAVQMAQVAEQAPAMPVVRIGNWPPHRAPAQVPVVPCRVRFGWGEHDIVVGSLGRYEPAKGYDRLIDAFRRVARADERLVLYGKGDEEASLARRAEGDARIALAGWSGDVGASLADMDLFVSSSREEAAPLAVLEAMRAGVPILATRTDGACELLAQQPAATLVEAQGPDAVDALAQALRAALDRIRARPTRRMRGAYDLQHHDRAAAVQAIECFYRERIAAGA